MDSASSSRVMRFGAFELDLAAGELRKSGLKIKLQEQPFQVLALLLERPGEVVTREQMRERLWPADTFVDFDRSLNISINKIREVLGDSPHHPRFIETLPRRGYRFIGQVEGRAEAPRPGPPRKRPWVWISAAAVLLPAIAGTVWILSRSQTEPPRTLPFTAFLGRELQPVFSPDGEQVAFVWNGEREDNYDIYVRHVRGEGQVRLTTDPAEDASPAWSPDGRYIAFCRRLGEGAEILAVPALGGPERKLGETAASWRWVIREGRVLSWAPGGKFLAVLDKTPAEPRGIFLLSLDTREKHRLTSPPPSWGEEYPSFSPDGKTLAFIRHHPYLNTDIYLLPVSEEGTARAKPQRLTTDEAVIRGLAWTADGRGIVFSSNRAGSQSLWRIAVSGGEPEPLGVGGDNVIDPSVSPQGGRLVCVQRVWSINIWRAAGPLAKGLAPAGGRGSPTRLISSTRSNRAPQFSPDGRRIVFQSARSGRPEIWVCDGDGSNVVQLTFMDSPECGDPRWSPDGRHIAFDCVTGGNKDIWTISAEGGQPRRITTHASAETRPSWSRDGRWIYFGSHRSGDWQIWKKPFEGGEAVQVTRHGGREAFESWDGRFLYYAKLPGISGIWRVPVEGGEETQVLDHGLQGRWALIDKGICVLNLDTPPQAEIEFYHLATQRLEKVGVLPEEVGIAVSPDGQWLLYTLTEYESSDIMLVENFR